MKKIILASNSPRRRQLLSDAGYQFKAINTDFDETFPDDLEPQDVAVHLAKSKNAHYREQFKDEILITADTIVVLDKTLLGKPQNHEEAKDMLQQLSGGIHQVITGVCVSDQTKTHTCYGTTMVFFDYLSEDEITYYIEKAQPFDKAGAYGIQDWIGLTRIKKIEGSYFNVMGLPVNDLYNLLKDQFGISSINQ